MQARAVVARQEQDISDTRARNTHMPPPAESSGMSPYRSVTESSRDDIVGCELHMSELFVVSGSCCLVQLDRAEAGCLHAAVSVHIVE